MATQSPGSVPNKRSTPGDRGVRTMRFQPLVNRMIRGMSRVPLVSRGIGSRLVVVYVVGRKSGKHYTIPVAYLRHDGGLLIGTPFGWARNLRTGDPVDIRLKGKRVTAEVQAFADEPTVVEHYAAMCADNRNFANFNKIGFDKDGTPNPDDLHAAWAAGARSFLLTPR